MWGERLMRRINIFLAVCVLGILCSLTGCQKDERFQTTYPLEEEVITATLEKTGLPGIISESETSSQKKGHINYVVRLPTETSSDISRSMFLASISASTYEGERVLCTMFDQPVVSDQLKWEDWKQQFLFATLLYGGFENEEDVYQAFLDKELPEGKTSFHWDAKLPEGYCKVAYTIYEHYIDDPEYGPPIQKRTATLRVNFYESYELYEKFMEIMANQQA